jgi:hypothetical protein
LPPKFINNLLLINLSEIKINFSFAPPKAWVLLRYKKIKYSKLSKK